MYTWRGDSSGVEFLLISCLTADLCVTITALSVARGTCLSHRFLLREKRIAICKLGEKITVLFVLDMQHDPLNQNFVLDMQHDPLNQNCRLPLNQNVV